MENCLIFLTTTNSHKVKKSKRGINLSLTVRTDTPKSGGVPSTARRASPKLSINERMKPSYSQNSIPNVNPFRLKQMNFRIKVCQGCRGPLQSSSGTVTEAPIDFCVARKERRTYKDPQTGQLIIFGFRAFKRLSRHLCHVRWSFPTDCLSQSATKTTLQKSLV